MTIASDAEVRVDTRAAGDRQSFPPNEPPVVTPPPVVEAITIGEEMRVTDHTAGLGLHPQITTLSDGGWVVTWQSDGQDGSGYGICQQAYGADGQPIGAEIRVNTYRTGSQDYPQIATLSGGGWVVTWQSYGQDGSGYGIYQQAYGADGQPIGAEIRVNTYTTNRQGSPQITALSDGGWVVTWLSQGQDGSGYGVYQQAYGADGQPVGTETRVNTYTEDNQVSPHVTALSDGGWVVTWTSQYQDSFGTGIYQQIYGADGQPVGVETRVSPYDLNNQHSPQIMALSDGGWVVTWGSDRQYGIGMDVYQRVYGADGQPAGAETQVSTASGHGQLRITELTDGGWVVTWTSANERFSAICQQVYGADGRPVGDVMQVNTDLEASVWGPEVTALSDGGWVVTWITLDDLRAYQQVFGADGQPVGTEMQISTHFASDFGPPRTTALPDNGWTVTWTSWSLDGSANGVYMRTFRLNDTSVVEGPIPSQTATDDDAFGFTFAADLFTDPDPGDTLTYSATLGDGGALPDWLAFDPATRTFSGTPDDRDVGTITIRVTATDASGASAFTDFTLTVNNVDEAPVITSNGGGATASVSIAENEAAVTTATATDPDAGARITWSLSGADAGLFAIDARTGALSFKAAPDFETPKDAGKDNVYDVVIHATDNTSLTDTQTLSVTVTDVDEAPIITSNGGGATASVSIAENTTAVTTATATGSARGTIIWSLSGTDAGLFAIDARTGVLTFKAAPDFETPKDAGENNVYDVTITATDDTGLTDTQILSVTVTDINEAPTITSNGGGATASVSVAENQTAVTTPTAEDPEKGAVTWSLSGADAKLFVIDARTGVLTFKAAPDFEKPADAGRNNVYDVTITATDAGKLVDTQTLAVTVTDIDEAPVITSNGGGTTASVSIAENQTAVTTATASDPENTAITWSLSGADAGLFTIDAQTGVLTFKAAPDFEKPADAGRNNVYDVTVTATDAGKLVDTQTLAVTVTNVNEAPVITSNGGGASAALKVAENKTAVTAMKAADPEKGAVTWSLSGADAKLFAIDARTGVLTFKAAPDFEKPADAGRNNVYDVTVKATDAGKLVDTQTLAVTVTDVKGKTLTGTPKADTLTGTPEDDVLAGAAGNDTLSGGAGKDKLTGGAGADTLTGGADADTFVFASVKDTTVAANGRDTITDFSQAHKDLIDLKAIDAKAATASNDAFSFIGTKAFSKAAGELRYEKKGGDTLIHGDVDGDGKADFSILIDASLDLTKADFIL